MDENENKEEQIKKIKQDIKTIKVEPFVWTSLKSLKKENETFNDVIWNLMKESTKEIGNENVKLIKFGRKTLFFETNFSYKRQIKVMLKNEQAYITEQIGIEVEYNDVKSQQSTFTLDLKIKKIYLKRISVNPSIFFGIDEKHKHLSSKYLKIYLESVFNVLKKEFGVSTEFSYELENITHWRKRYYNYSLSEESFIEDIENPLNLSVTESPNDEQKNNLLNSPSEKGW